MVDGESMAGQGAMGEFIGQRSPFAFTRSNLAL
jgi:hypothetical protein